MENVLNLINDKSFYSYWKRLWRWTTSESLSCEELASVLGNKDVVEGLKHGLASYKPHKAESFTQLQTKHPEQTKLLSVVQTLQNYIVSNKPVFLS